MLTERQCAGQVEAVKKAAISACAPLRIACTRNHATNAMGPSTSWRWLPTSATPETYSAPRRIVWAYEHSDRRHTSLNRDDEPVGPCASNAMAIPDNVTIIYSGGDGATLGRRVDRRKLSPEVEVDGGSNGEAVQARHARKRVEHSRGRRCPFLPQRVTAEGWQ